MERYKVKPPSQGAFEDALQVVAEGRVPLYVQSEERCTLSVGKLPPDLERRVLALGGQVTSEERYDVEAADS